MAYLFDPLNIIIIAVAVGVFWRLRSVLGQRTGHERPPVDRFRRSEAPAPAKPAVPVALPEAASPHAPEAQPAPTDSEPARPVWQGFAEEGSAVAQGLAAIAAADPSFTPQGFIAGAKTAHEMIVTAFAKADKAALKPLLARDVYDGFAAAIDARKAAGEVLETRYVGINRCDITAASVENRRALVTLRLVSEIISARLGLDGAVLEGDPKRVREVTDLWSFERDVTSRDPNWKLVTTGLG